MRISILSIGAIASVLALNAYATSSTVTSRDYVDAQDALKQNKIPVTGTNSATPGTTVVTYTGTAGQIGERGIFDYETGYDDENGGVASGHEGDLVTAGNIVPAIDDLYSIVETETSVLDATCEVYDNNRECILWNLRGKIVNGSGGSCRLEGEYCSNNNQCCGDAVCNNNKCEITIIPD